LRSEISIRVHHPHAKLDAGYQAKIDPPSRANKSQLTFAFPSPMPIPAFDSISSPRCWRCIFGTNCWVYQKDQYHWLYYAGKFGKNAIENAPSALKSAKLQTSPSEIHGKI
jgi:hypothetical protein